MFTIQEIMDLLPHRYPFLLVDRVVEYDPGVRIVGLKNVTINEPFFAGHFPGHPIMPGVLIVEALAQTGGILALKELGGEKKLAYFAGIERCRFRRPVLPGDQLLLNVTIIAHKGPVWKMHGEARVGDALAAEADLTAAIGEAFADPVREGAGK
jgi:beta-hydroxyacyl-ACP dehydratase FabZ